MAFDSYCRLLIASGLSTFPRFRGQAQRRFITSPSQDSLQPKRDCLSQGHAIDPSNKHQQDTQCQSVRAGMKARSGQNHAIDAASGNSEQRPTHWGIGNEEGVGMIEQVGSSSGSALFFEKGGKQGKQ